MENAHIYSNGRAMEIKLRSKLILTREDEMGFRGVDYLQDNILGAGPSAQLPGQFHPDHLGSSPI